MMSKECKAKTLYIPIEVKDRELVSQLLLSFYAVVSKGCRVYIGSTRAIHRLISTKNAVGGIYIKVVTIKNIQAILKQNATLFLLLTRNFPLMLRTMTLW